MLSFFLWRGYSFNEIDIIFVNVDNFFMKIILYSYVASIKVPVSNFHNKKAHHD